jgi:hypothetical protein
MYNIVTPPTGVILPDHRVDKKLCTIRNRNIMWYIFLKIAKKLIIFWYLSFHYKRIILLFILLTHHNEINTINIYFFLLFPLQMEINRKWNTISFIKGIVKIRPLKVCLIKHSQYLQGRRIAYENTYC